MELISEPELFFEQNTAPIAVHSAAQNTAQSAVVNDAAQSAADDFDLGILLFDLSKPHVSREQIQKIIGMKIKNPDLYRRALVHKSLQKDVRESQDLGHSVCGYMIESNERLEFLGDAVFNLVVGHYLFEKYPNKDEGFLTRMRTKIVRSAHCVKFANILGLGAHILTGSKIIRVKDSCGVVVNGKVLEDSFEAFIGALYLDLGFRYAELFLRKLISEHVKFDDLLFDDNYKDILMRYSQVYGYELPIYKTIGAEGPAHNRVFTVEVYLKKPNQAEKKLGTGTNCSKKAAEQDAAKNACSLFNTDIQHITNRDLPK